MFKLKKILNKHNNAPELEILPVALDTIAVRESIYYLSQSELANFLIDSTDYPAYYVVYADFDEYADNRNAECVRITPDMIFEVKCNGIPTVGLPFALEKEEGYIGGFRTIKIADSPNTADGYIVDVTPYSKNGCVLVRFHCKQ